MSIFIETDNIPVDVFLFAEAVATNLVEHALICGEQIRFDKSMARRIAASAILSERETCAKIADDYALEDHPRLSHGSEMNAWWSGQDKAAHVIAKAIRRIESGANAAAEVE